MADTMTTPNSLSREYDNQAQDSSPESSNGRAIVLHPNSRNHGIWSFSRGTIITAAFALLLGPLTFFWPQQQPCDPTDYAERTRRILKQTPLIDGHNDLPLMFRLELRNQIYDERFDFNNRLLGHTDLSRMRQGMMGGQFWSVFIDCDAKQKHFEDPSWVVRDTLEQIDVTHRFIEQYRKDLQFCDTPSCVRKAFRSGRIASMIGIEGGHQLGSSIGSVRQMYSLGARYMTLTHNCDNAFATSATTVATGGVDHGLTKLGREVIEEMNRLGMMVDLSHVSHQTMRDVLGIAKAPVIFSHSGAYQTTQHLRNVPDDVLRQLKYNGGVVMAVFLNGFLNKENPSAATIHDVVDHIFHIADVCGWDCVGIGADFFGPSFAPTGLEDVSKYPNLIELVMQRGATDSQAQSLAGENILRVWEQVERKAQQIQATGRKPIESEYSEREWTKGFAEDPYMLRGSRERLAADAPPMPDVYNTGKKTDTSGP
ncbi:hypothetical protein BU24DRAFT_409220 [Aaosphaeria arxii CBS 175.79]|uniref:Dipeptidase n=1 Tax=Aaosphaeria arxii CBS 175.79 TaxID=1450172 RepID=A0A6A5XRX1_9PLEO|nr:uncharacterized protein BU24DRAFT_409220 [Aaosphaeria arxii CBS 175.79]KAF2016065.1 hypothetical protein BU24DRAFT_409220 [Aaosphaeria arxii CBS 175.79]